MFAGNERPLGRTPRTWRRLRAWHFSKLRSQRAVAHAMVSIVVLAGLDVAQIEPAPREAQQLAPQQLTSVAGQPVKMTQPAGHNTAPTREIPSPRWPAVESAVVSLATGGAAGQQAARAGQSPVLVGKPDARDAAAPSRVRTTVLSQQAAAAAGVQGVVVRLNQPDATAKAASVKLTMEYGEFASAFGGAWASRLRLVALPECALTTPDKAGCQGIPLPSKNNAKSQSVSADVRLPAGRSPDRGLTGNDLAAATSMLVALSAGASGGAGNFGATTLASSSTWSAGGSAGGFTWSYAMQSPPSSGGSSPTLGFAYSSQSVDGRMAASNNQVSWIGSGFSMEQSYVERKYKPCSKNKGGTANNTEDTGDLCWNGENAILSLNGSAVELLKGADGRWHPRAEDGSKIELLTDTSFGNGDNNGEYWKVTATDGKKYWFGRNRLPGWQAGYPTTNSVLTMPVAGNNTGEPCRQTTFANSFCDQGWRWSLDYVEDVYGNSMSYWYGTETSYYTRNLETLDNYHRAGYLTRIDYGTDNRDGTEYKATGDFVQDAPSRITFDSGERCLASCWTGAAWTTPANKPNWPDTPWDQECTSGQTGCTIYGPSFWTARRLTSVTTNVWKAATLNYQQVDRWTLRHSFPDHQNDGGLWLEGITRTGMVGTQISLPEVTFAGINKPNRVDASGADWAPAMNWRRVNSIMTETGGQIFVNYSGPDCVAGSSMPASPDNNTRRCSPVRWAPPGYVNPITDYFHKYVVDSVVQTDHTAGSPQQRTEYVYQNPDNLALWHYDDDDGFVEADYKTWGQWRGYPRVVTKIGTGTEQMVSEVLYFRGMHGDKKADGTTRSVTVTGTEGGAATDYDQFAGMPREKIQWLGSSVLTAVVSTPWRSTAKATRTVNGAVAESRFVGSASSANRTLLDGGAYRRTSTAATYDDTYGVPLTSASFGTDPAVTTDDSCTSTTYARNTTGTTFLLSPIKEIKTWVGACGTPPTSAEQIASHQRFSFDGLPYDPTTNDANPPVRGAITRVETIKDWNGGNPLFQTLASNTYDAAGRNKTSTDIAGQTTSVAYTPALGGPVTKMTVNHPKVGWVSSVDLEPWWGVVKTETDINSRKTNAAYDALGRRIKVWLPGRTITQTPDTEFQYSMTKTAPTKITTLSLDMHGLQQPSYQFFDGWLRLRQEQSPAYGSGAMMSDTYYDTAGRNWKSNGTYWNQTATAGPAMVLPDDLDVPTQIRNYFDSAGRVTASAYVKKNVEQWRTITAYHGDHTTVTPPDGAAATETWTDGNGRTTELRQFHGQLPSGGFDATRYSYTLTGQLKSVIDASGNVWSYKYDLQGRQIEAVDPDKGIASSTYNEIGELQTVTDARNVTLAYTYDELGRVTSLRDGTPTGNMRASWTYDTPARGLTGSSTRYVDGNAYTTVLNQVDAQYRPKQTTVKIPAVEGNLSGDFIFKSDYWANGSPNTVTMPQTADLPEEKLTIEYDASLPVPEKLKSTINLVDSYYVSDVGYTNLWQPETVTRSTATTGTPWVQSKTEYDESTGRLKFRKVLKSSGASSYITDAEYQYDDAGNILKIDDKPVGGPRDTQCFSYDHLRRMTEAWTPTSADCDQTPTVAGLGGPAKYWQSWSFGTATDSIGRVGNRKTQVDHGTAAGDVTTTYNYPAQGSTAVRPHAVTSVSKQDNSGTQTWGYTYDNAGNTRTRPGSNGQQTLTWDAEGHLETVTDTSGTHRYLYDSAGNRLITREANGTTTLHLGSTELRRSAGVVTATRYYSFAGESVAQRTATGITWLAADAQGTGQVAVTADAAQTVTQRRQTPYGEARGSSTWVNPKGFVGGNKDSTGLTHLGAREYDPLLGKFISVDPIVDFGNPQQMNAYAYANNSPVTYSDPSGLIWDDCKTFVCGMAKGFLSTLWDALNVWEMAKSTVKMLTNLKGAFKGLEKEAKRWSDKTGNEVTGWLCAISGVCAIWDSCVSNFNPAECGQEVGAVLADLAISVLSGGAAGLAAKGAQLLTKLAKKLDIDLPSTKSDSDNGSDGDSNNGDDSNTDDPADINSDEKDAVRGTDTSSDASTPDPAKDGCHSFSPETLVLMADGTERPIKDIQLGDKVVATDPETGETTSQPVVTLHENLDREFADVTVSAPSAADEAGSPSGSDIGAGTIRGPTAAASATLKTTTNHPFWDETLGTWVLAGDLHVGHRLHTVDGTVVTVTALRTYKGAALMRDLTVDNVHTYYVVAGDQPVLVHNCGGGVDANGEQCACPSPRPATWDLDAADYPDSAIHAGEAGGHTRTLTLDRPGADARREQSLAGIPTRPNLDRDEFPPAIFAEGGAGASVKHIGFSDNRGAGSTMKNQLVDIPNGGRVVVRIHNLDMIGVTGDPRP